MAFPLLIPAAALVTGSVVTVWGTSKIKNSVSPLPVLVLTVGGSVFAAALIAQKGA